MAVYGLTVGKLLCKFMYSCSTRVSTGIPHRLDPDLAFRCNADPDPALRFTADPNPTFHSDVDPDSAPHHGE